MEHSCGAQEGCLTTPIPSIGTPRLVGGVNGPLAGRDVSEERRVWWMGGCAYYRPTLQSGLLSLVGGQGLFHVRAFSQKGVTSSVGKSAGPGVDFLDDNFHVSTELFRDLWRATKDSPQVAFLGSQGEAEPIMCAREVLPGGWLQSTAPDCCSSLASSREPSWR